MCCIYNLVYSLETHIKHVHLEASKGYKMQHRLLCRPCRGGEQPHANSSLEHRSACSYHTAYGVSNTPLHIFHIV